MGPSGMDVCTQGQLRGSSIVLPSLTKTHQASGDKRALPEEKQQHALVPSTQGIPHSTPLCYLRV